MSILLACLIAACSIAIILAGLLAFLRNPEKAENKWFFALSLVLGIWIVISYADSDLRLNIGIATLLVKLDFGLAIFIGWCLLQFVSYFVKNSDNSRKWSEIALNSKFRFYTIFLNALLIVLIATNFIFSVSLSNHYAVVGLKASSIFYLVIVVPYLIGSLLILVITYFNSVRAQRRKLGLISLGFIVASLANIATNLIFPNFVNQESTIKALNLVGYIGILFLVICMFIAITTRRLFDIRFALVRSVVYVVIVGVVATFYSGVIVLSGYLLVGGQHPNFRFIITSLVVTLFVAFTFQYLRRSLDRVSNKLFLQDAYELQDVISKINAITTTTINLTPLLTKSASVLEEALIPTHCLFILYTDDEKIIQIEADGKHEYEIDDKHTAKLLRPYLKEHQPIISTLLDEQSEIANIMKKMSADVLCPLYTKEGVVGCLVFGEKRTGAIFSRQDIRLFNLASASLSVAIRNALRFEEVENFNVTLQQKVEEATRKLRHTNERLHVLDQTKDDFISMASHQLRTPLTSVKGYVSMVLDGDAGKINPMQRKLLDQSFISAQRMVYLIADLLNISRLKTGKFIIELAPTNLATLVRDEVAQLVETASSRGLDLVYHKPEQFPVLMLDETKLRQVIMNFIDNAIYYTPNGGHIEVKLNETPKLIELTVNDDGIGVPRIVQHHLFTKFYRAPNALRARPDGTGLGLYMAKKVIISHGGAIIFHSNEGKGSTFGFSFDKNRLKEVSTKS